MDIKHLLLGADDEGSNEYKSGWCDAIFYLNDNFVIQKRNGEPISITFDFELDEDLLKKMKGEQDARSKSWHRSATNSIKRIFNGKHQESVENKNEK